MSSIGFRFCRCSRCWISRIQSILSATCRLLYNSLLLVQCEHTLGRAILNGRNEWKCLMIGNVERSPYAGGGSMMSPASVPWNTHAPLLMGRDTGTSLACLASAAFRPAEFVFCPTTSLSSPRGAAEFVLYSQDIVVHHYTCSSVGLSPQWWRGVVH